MRDSHAVALIVLAGMAHAAVFIASNAQCYSLVDDLVIISSYLHNFTHALHTGILYPRWMSELFAGAGAPVYVYYSPLAYFIGAVFALPAAFDPDGVFQLGLALAAGLTCSALASYAWLRQRADTSDALLVVLTVLLLPSQFTAMHFNFSLALIWAGPWFPLGMLCLDRMAAGREPRLAVPFTAILALILITHMPSALLFWPVLGIYALMLRPKAATVLMLGSCYLLACALAAIYLLPLLANWNAVQMGRYMHFTADYKAPFVGPESLPLFFIPEILLYASPFVLLAPAALWLTRRTGSRMHAHAWFAGLFVLGLTPLFFAASAPVWEHLFYFRLLQTPFRLLALFSVLSPILLLAIRAHTTLPWFAVIAVIAMLVGWQIAWGEYAVRRETSHTATARRMMRMGFELKSTATEFATAWMPKEPTPLIFQKVERLPQAEITGGEGSVRVRAWGDERIALWVSAARAATVQIKQYYFPGWEAHANGGTLTVKPDAEGLMLIDVPAGETEITLAFDALPGAEKGRAISLAALAALGGLWFHLSRGRAEAKA